jgi:hypothetical protein
MKKALFTLNVRDAEAGFPDGYDRRITDITYPHLAAYAKRIGAIFGVIDERRFPDWPVAYEKLQLYEQAAEYDWTIFIDSDALVHPETIDFTEFLDKDTVAHNGSDFAAVRWDYDRFFWRDGRNIGSCNWFCIASDWCREIWHRPKDIALTDCLWRIHPTVQELEAGITPCHLIDDFLLSRNIAKYGLKFTTIRDLLARIGLPQANFLWHTYTETPDVKVKQLQRVADAWCVGERGKNHAPDLGGTT